jgi:hypothetical protein
MTRRLSLLLLGVLSGLSFLSVDAAAQQPPAAARSAPRTSWGAPDLQGVWDFRTITPLERPDNLAGKAVLTEKEAAALESQAAAQRVDRSPTQGDPGTYNQFWFDYGNNVAATRQTSLIVDPPDGKLPALTQAAQQAGAAGRGRRPVRYRVGGIGTDGPEDRGLAERCMIGFNTGPPMLPSGYNNNMQIFQTGDHVVILNEMVHDARIVPLDGRSHLGPGIRQWMGDARGRWEGDTLVVETRNFTAKTGSFNPSVVGAVGTGETLRLVERFRRQDAETLIYEFTVHDPETFTQPFTASVPMRRSDELLYEYACHEGNYGLHNILSGARMEEAGRSTTSR